MTTHDQTTPPPPSPPVIKVAIIEDQRKFREYLAVLIDGSPRLPLRRQFRSMEDALDRIQADLQDVVLVDSSFQDRGRGDGAAPPAHQLKAGEP